MKTVFTFSLLIASISVFSQVNKILIVATNVDSVGCHASGTFLREIAYPFQEFTNRGFVVDVVTPKGGATAIYEAAKENEALAEIKNSELFRIKTHKSLSPDQVRTGDYAGIYYPGGHGQYWDVQNDERIQQLTATIYEHGAVLGSAGHGTASLVNVRLSDGKYLVDKKRMTSFPWWAEKKWMDISEYGKLLPFDQEEVLKRRGADLVICTELTIDKDELTHVVDTGNRMVTGSFANSARWVAEEMAQLISSRAK